jgi:hypothetical protein
MVEKRDETTEQSEFEYYLPGMPSLSAGAGRVERFLTGLFARHQPIYVRVRR